MCISTKRSGKMTRVLLVAACAGLLFQAGCSVDPDLLLQAFTQFFTEVAVFVTDSALVNLR